MVHEQIKGLQPAMSYSKSSQRRGYNDRLIYTTKKSHKYLSSAKFNIKVLPCDCGEQPILEDLSATLRTKASGASIVPIDNEPVQPFMEILPKEEPKYEEHEASEYEKTLSREKPRKPRVRVFKDPGQDFEHISVESSSMGCGEPMRAQYLQLDFNIIEGVDDSKFISKKCADFWNFIDGHSELKPLRVEAEPYKFDESKLFKTDDSSSSSSTAEELKISDITAQALNWLGREKVMTGSLATKQIEGQPCEPMCNSYVEYITKSNGGWPHEKHHRRQEPNLATSVSPVPKSIASLSAKPKPAHTLVQIMEEMDKWDLNHPKSMDPPVHAKDKERKCKMIPYIEKCEEKLCEKGLH